MSRAPAARYSPRLLLCCSHLPAQPYPTYSRTIVELIDFLCLPPSALRDKPLPSRYIANTNANSNFGANASTGKTGEHASKTRNQIRLLHDNRLPHSHSRHIALLPPVMATPPRNHHYHHLHTHPTAPFTRPAYPAYADAAAASHFPSASSSAFQSSSSLASLSSSQQAPVMSSQPQPQGPSSSSSTQHQYQHHTSAAAPLPSPNTTHQPSQYFGSLHPQTGPGPGTNGQAAQQGQPVSLQRHTSLERRPDRAAGGGGTGAGAGAGAGASATSETMACLRDYNLVAEAAKRAQMAVLMRDLEGVEL